MPVFLFSFQNWIAFSRADSRYWEWCLYVGQCQRNQHKSLVSTYLRRSHLQTNGLELVRYSYFFTSLNILEFPILRFRDLIYEFGTSTFDLFKICFWNPLFSVIKNAWFTWDTCTVVWISGSLWQNRLGIAFEILVDSGMSTFVLRKFDSSWLPVVDKKSLRLCS